MLFFHQEKEYFDIKKWLTFNANDYHFTFDKTPLAFQLYAIIQPVMLIFTTLILSDI